MTLAKTILGCLATLTLSAAAFAQTPSQYDQNRQPITGGAGVGGLPPIASFPSTNAVGPATGMQQYQPPRPGLSPYLNLNRNNNNRGLSAVDYYNFVRPAQQSLGSYQGRQTGPYNPGFRYGNPSTVESDVILDPDAQLRSAGMPATFMNTGRYFNSMGTMGLGVRPQQQMQQQRSSNFGRRY